MAQSSPSSRVVTPVIAAVAGLAVVGGAFVLVLRSRDGLAAERTRMAIARAELEAARVPLLAAEKAEADATAILDARKARLAELKAPRTAAPTPAADAAPPLPASVDETDRLLTLAARCLAHADTFARGRAQTERRQFDALLIRMSELVSFQQKRNRTNALPDLDLLMGRALAKVGHTQRALDHLSRSFDQASDAVGPSERLEAAAALVPLALTAGDLMLTTKAMKVARDTVAELETLDQDPDAVDRHPTLLVRRSPADRRLLLLELETEGLRRARETRYALDRFESRRAAAEAFADPRRLRGANLAFAAFLAQASTRDEDLDRAEAAARDVYERDRQGDAVTAMDRIESNLRLLSVLFKRGRGEEGQALHAELLKALADHPFADRAALGPLGGDITEYLIASRAWDAAEGLLASAWRACASPDFAQDITPGERLMVASQYAALHEARGQPKEAETWRATLATLRAAGTAAPPGQSGSNRIRGGVR